MGFSFFDFCNFLLFLIGEVVKKHLIIFTYTAKINR